ncbi:MAG: septal ring lytic transglycosylase RlpA family protein [Rickettsiales bacterium]|jgi:rare lipoprotein A (peptidoglycan hydrolase)|nr:septal ring lytic transglycosylase RlpA family protein [Rickettsiales bacterium]
MKKFISLAVLTALLAACGDKGASDNNFSGYGTEGFAEENLSADQSLNDAYLMAAAPKYYIGSSYKVETVQYTPTEDMNYNQTGIAGIIPAELNGSKTSNGETFDASQMVATSKTLPLPTIARITNLDNGTSAIVRVNNRGPFVNTRIMDLSPAAAGKLGITGQSKVQVQVLADQSIAVKNATLGSSAATPVESYSPVSAADGEYSVQVAAFYAEDRATNLAQGMKQYGNVSIINENDMYKVRITGLDSAKARSIIDTLRSSEGMAPGLLKNGKWINADSI